MRPVPPRVRPVLTAVACGVLLAAAAALALSAAHTKSPTGDEPTHLVSGWSSLHGDYRLEVANPAGWKMLAAAIDRGLPLRPPAGGPLAAKVAFAPDGEAVYAVRTLFGSPGVDGVAAVARARAVMVAVNLLLGIVIAVWAYQLAGSTAAVVATALFAFDPTVLAQLPLVKSDLLAGLSLATAGWLTWHAGRQLTVARVVALGVTAAVAVNVKFTGVLLAPIVGGLLIARAIGSTPWTAFGRERSTRAGRLAAVIVAGVIMVGLTVAGTWAVYRFRYRPAPAVDVAIDMPAVLYRLQGARASSRLGRVPTPAEVVAAGPGLVQRIVAVADEHRLLPQAFLAGVTHQAADVSLWTSYLDGRIYADGDASYFPKAIAYKTPLPELAAFAVAAAVGVVALTRRNRPARWSVACVAVPAVLFGVSALTTNLNVGLRTVLPLFALADVAAGGAAAWAVARRPRVAGVVAVSLLTTLAVTAARTWPDYLPFFNAAVGGPVQGLAHLADSNVDWGQDLTALADWQRRHPGTPVYADLFLAVDPDAVGLHVHWLFEPDAAGGARLNLPDGPAVIAVSANHLVGLYTGPAQRAATATLLARCRPREVLHGSIYLYDYRP